MAKQNAQHRIKRFEQGNCPVHGLFMSQIDRWYKHEDGKEYTIVGCPRRNCKIVAKAYSPRGPWALPEHLLPLLNDSLPDPEYLDKTIEPKKTKKSLSKHKKDIWNKTKGICFYCGKSLTTDEMTIDHFIPEDSGGTHVIQNLVPSCKSCNSSKGVKTIEEFRFLMEMRHFESEQGISFTLNQVRYLERKGFLIGTSSYRFWFEINDACP